MVDVKIRKILVVDDEEEILKFLVKTLERFNYQVITADSGYRAIELAKKTRPEAIILDIILPDMRGEEIKKILSEDIETKNIPVIFLTGILSKDEQLIFEKLAGKCYTLAKPASTEEILETLEKAFKE